MIKPALVETERRLNGSRYYTVEPIFVGDWWLPAGFRAEEVGIKWLEMEDWCWAMFGSRPMNTWPEAGDRWFVNDRSFWFKNAEDLMMFKLRWS